MKGIILAGGKGTRLRPLTDVLNKHLLPVAGVPMIYHPIRKLIEAGIREILIISGPEDLGILAEQLGSGKKWGADFTYKVQDSPGGIADALSCAEGFAAASPMAVILGDNIFSDSLAGSVDRFVQEKKQARIFLKKVVDPSRFGVAVVENGKITNLIEKPASFKSDLAVTGLYMYTPIVFDLINTISPSRRGELEITDINRLLLAKKELGFEVLSGQWIDAGTHDSYSLAQSLAPPFPANFLMDQ